jgi:glycosyltransferase involved in cell wall biosynthesis
LGAIEDIDELLRAVDILCVTSSWGEGFPNIIGESMASGVYCITTDVGESSNIVEDSGKVVPADDEHELYIAMKEASNLSVEERSLIGKKSREKITTNFSINAMSNSFSNLYTKIIMEE